MAGLESVRAGVRQSQGRVGVWEVQEQVPQRERELDMNGIAEGRGLVRGSAAGKVVRGRRCRRHLAID